MQFDSVSQTAYTTQASLTWAHTCSGDRRLLVVGVYVSNNVAPTVTYNGIALTQLLSQQLDPVLAVFFLINPPAGTFNVVATFQGVPSIQAISASYTGVEPIGEPENTGFVNGAFSTSFTLSTPTAANQSWGIGFNKADTTNPKTGATGTTIRADLFAGTGIALFDTGGPQVPGPVSLTTSVAGGSVGWRGMIATFKSAGLLATTGIGFGTAATLGNAPTPGPVKRIAYAKAQSTGAGDSLSLPAIDTTGASLIVVGIGPNIKPTVSDNKGNTYTLLGPSDGRPTLAFVSGPIGGPNHIVTVSANGGYTAAHVAAYSGTATVAPLDQQNFATSSSTASLSTGPVTPTQNNELCITSTFTNDTVTGTSAVSGNYTIQGNIPCVGGATFGAAYADRIQVNAATDNPTWTQTPGNILGAIIATFKAAPTIPLNGSATITFASNTSLTIGAPLAAGATFAFAAAGSITASAQPLAAGASFALAAAGTLTAPVRFAAQAGIQFATIQASLDAPLLIQAGITFGASASLLAGSPLEGTAGLSFGVTTAAIAPQAQPLAAVSTIAIGSPIRFLTTTARFAAAAAIVFSVQAGFVARLAAGATITFGTNAALLPGPRSTLSEITINGENVRRRVRMAGLTIRDVLNDAPNTCQLTIEGDAPAVGQSLRVTINEGGIVLFAGTIQSVDETYESIPNRVAWAVQGIDDTARANARRPFGTFAQMSASDIAAQITADFTSGFQTEIEPGLPAISIVFDGTDAFIACLTRIASAIGGYCKVEDNRVYLFTSDTTPSVEPIDASHPFLDKPSIRLNVDASQIRTRVYGKGYGENILSDVQPDETLLPIQDGANFTAYGGKAIAGRTADGAQSDRFSYTRVIPITGGTLVGPGASPTAAPKLAMTPGAGISDGRHDLTVLFVTATGKSLVSPVATITIGPLAAPGAAPVAGNPLNGAGVDEGYHSYSVSLVTDFGGETVPGPVSNSVYASASQGQIPDPGGVFIQSQTAIQGNGLNDGDYTYAVTFINTKGETRLSAYSNAWVHCGPQNVGSRPAVTPGGVNQNGGGPITDPGGQLPTAWNDYIQYYATYVTATGETAPATGNGAFMNGRNAFNVATLQSPDNRVTGIRIYRLYMPGGGGASPQGSRFVVQLSNATQTYLDKASEASIASNPHPPSSDTGTADPGTMQPFNRVQLSGIPTGPAGTTGRGIYRAKGSSSTIYNRVTTIGNNTATDYVDSSTDSGLGQEPPAGNTTGTAVQVIPVTQIPIGGPGIVARRLYRDGRLVTTINNNTATNYTDSTPNSALGANAPVVSTAKGNQIAVSSIPTGGAQVTARELYLSPAGGGPRKFALLINDNTTTTATLSNTDASLAGAATEPIADTSGLQQPAGQVNPGTTVLPVASAASFLPTGGWVQLGGNQTVRYTGITAQSLTGIPPFGPGALTTTVLFGSQAIPAAMLAGIAGLTRPLLKGSAVHVWVQRDNELAQAEHAARTGGDGIVEYVVSDFRRGEDSITELCDADLELFARPIITANYATRDIKTKSGKLVSINLSTPPMRETLIIQEVTINEIDRVPGLWPRFTVKASSVRFSLDDILRRLVSAKEKL